VGSVVYQSFKGEETANLEDHKEIGGETLPNLPRHYLPRLFSQFSTFDRMLALREKLVPVAILPHLTLYGAVGAVARKRALASGMRVVAEIQPDDYQAALRGPLSRSILYEATRGLKTKRPEFSAHKRLSQGQVIFAIMFAIIVFSAGYSLTVENLFAGFSLLCGIFFMSVIALRLFSLVDVHLRKETSICRLNDYELPTYTVLVPVFREVGVLDQLIGALSALSYPIDKLDVKIILEETDVAMMRAIKQRGLPSHFDVIIVPPGSPQTKPRALNYALQFARGELLTIFDAEDIPEPMQLRKAAETFKNAEPELACLQAELTFYNPNENWLTRQFTVEYATLFKTMLPSLGQSGLPLLLGGTSNHFRISVLRKIGGWDPFNVTEDADLGLRLARLGYYSATLDSVTYEEANTEFRNWLQQRARWLKGFLQTWLVHMRAPVKTLREIGWGGFWVMNAMTIGIVVSALFHPFLIGFAIYALLTGQVIRADMSTFTQVLAAINLDVLALGYSLVIFAGHKALRMKAIQGWWFTLLTMPIYWILITLAGWMAIWQFIVRPFHWNKTRHGLSAFQKSQVQK
jgi:glycosyltransferase XagB